MRQITVMLSLPALSGSKKDIKKKKNRGIRDKFRFSAFFRFFRIFRFSAFFPWMVQQKVLSEFI